MIFERLPLAGAFRIRLAPHSDERGFFARRFCRDTFVRQGLEADFVQRSVSFNVRCGTLRGLHFQAPPAMETKLVRCTQGAAFDVIVDLRRNSPTFAQWHREIISAENHVTIYVPRGFAHGFQTLVDSTEIDYEITPAYQPESARGVLWSDADLAISWPIDSPTMTARDDSHPRLREIEPL